MLPPAMLRRYARQPQRQEYPVWQRLGVVVAEFGRELGR
jgi:hypothetical protein